MSGLTYGMPTCIGTANGSWVPSTCSSRQRQLLVSVSKWGLFISSKSGGLHLPFSFSSFSWMSSRSGVTSKSRPPADTVAGLPSPKLQNILIFFASFKLSLICRGTVIIQQGAQWCHHEGRHFKPRKIPSRYRQRLTAQCKVHPPCHVPSVEKAPKILLIWHVGAFLAWCRLQ